jgi:AraC-like DNA-binding protein
MTLLLNTAAVPAVERDDATRSVIEQMSVPTDVSLLGPDDADTRMDVWQLGPVSALRNDGRAVRLRRTARHVRQEAPEVLSLIVQLRGRSLHRQGGRDQVTPAGDLVVADLTGTYESDTGLASLATYIAYRDLGVTVDLGRRAMHRLRTSPVYDLVRHHLVQVDRCAESVDEGPVAVAVAESTVELVRGLLVSAAEDRTARDVLHETLATRIEAYIRQHLANSHLSPELIARTHHISVRTLYSLWSTRGTSVMEWVMHERLEGARRELEAAAPSAATTVAATARRSGFSDPTHFSRRFRAAYGLPPAQWRRARWAAAVDPVLNLHDSPRPSGRGNGSL